MRPLENLSRLQRSLTPLPFALYLLQRVKALIPAERVAVLWVERWTHYATLWPQVQLWGRGQDARRYRGPFPIIAHPPCGPWGKYRSRCRQSRSDGVIAMRLVHYYGGCVEQPVGSSLFREHGLPDVPVETVNQSLFGHQAIKATLLYFSKPLGE